jgi:AcrR family transcriptional regulator
VKPFHFLCACVIYRHVARAYCGLSNRKIFVAESLVKTKVLPKQARAKARVLAILAATKELVTTVEPEKITTTAIARTAEIPVGSVYQYFEDKVDILQQLYGQAYTEVMEEVAASITEIDTSSGFEAVVRSQLQDFWCIARAHPTFRALTRWANSEFSFSEVTPDAQGGLTTIISETLQVSGVTIPAERREAVLQTSTTLISVLVDAAIEEHDDNKAQALMDELAFLLGRYLT